MLKKFEIELDVPEDVVSVEFRLPKKGEEYIQFHGYVGTASYDFLNSELVIAREKKWRPVELSDFKHLPMMARFRDNPSGDWVESKLFGLVNFGNVILYASETHRWNYCEVEDS